MQFYDTVVVDGVRKTRDGYLVASAKTARSGVQIYGGREVDPNNEHGLRDRAEVRVYRPPEEVFSRDAMASMAHRPVTVDHPSESVTAGNWKRLSGGMTGDEVARDGEFVRVPLTLMDQAAIDAWESGKKELSWGYSCDLSFADGVTPSGEHYDAVQSKISANHLAMVAAGRAGSECRVGDQGAPDDQRLSADHNNGGHTVADTLRTVTVDSVPYAMSDQTAALVERMQGLLRDSAKTITDANTANATALATKDAELATKDAEITALKAKVVTDAALDALVADRATIVGKAKAMAPTLDTAGKSNMDIKRAVLGDAAKDKSDAYVDAAFDLRTADGKSGDILRSAIGDSVNVTDAASARDKAMADRRARNATRHQHPAAA